MLDLYMNIKRFRLARKMSQDSLARLTGYTDRSSIAKIEKGLVDLPQSKIVLFANALNVDAGTLMGRTDNSPLSADERYLIDRYRILNNAGKEKIRDNISDLASLDKYTEP